MARVKGGPHLSHWLIAQIVSIDRMDRFEQRLKTESIISVECVDSSPLEPIEEKLCVST